LPLDLQGKLLRAVEENVVFRLGSSDPIKVNVRIIAATNKNLEDYVSRGLFRHDLFYRLNVVGLTISPLRERSEDIPLLIKYFSSRSAALLGLSKLPRMCSEVLDSLTAYDWPGNVRELENAVYRAFVLAEGEQLSVHHMLPVSARERPSLAAPAPAGDKNFQTLRRRAADNFTKDYLESCLRHNGGNVTLTAEALGMRRTSLQRLLKRTGLDAGKFREPAPPK
jgi:DNA-binding NtrC family response regulator